MASIGAAFIRKGLCRAEGQRLELAFFSEEQR